MPWYTHMAAAFCVVAMVVGWDTWIFYMGAVCLAAMIIGWLVAWAFDPDQWP